MMIYPPQGSSGPVSPPNTVVSFAYDPSVSPGRGCYNDFTALWSAYQASKGPVDIYVAQGFSPPPGVYVFRKDTTLRGKFNTYTSPSQIDLSEGVVFRDCLRFVDICVRGNADTTPVLDYTDDYPSIHMVDATFTGNGAAPMLRWTKPHNSAFLNVCMDGRSEIRRDGGRVFSLEGTDTGNNRADMSIRTADSSIVAANTIESNVNASLGFNRTGLLASISLDQPGYLGENAPLDPNESIDAQIQASLQAHSLMLASPSDTGAPQLLLLGASKTVENDQWTDMLPNAQALPPVITAGVNLIITARDASSTDSAIWIVKGYVKSSFLPGGASTNPLGLQDDFHDADPGAASWQYRVLLNDPADNMIRIQFRGENGKKITCTIAVIEALSLAIPG